MKYSELAKVYERLELTSKRLEKTHFITQLLKSCSKEDLEKVVLLLQGKVFPSWDENKIGVAARTVLKSINQASGIEQNKIETEWKKIGDLGVVAEKLMGKKKQHTLFSQELTVTKVFNNLRKLSTLEGEGTVAKKNQLVTELLTSAEPLEVRYIVRTVLEDLRVGVGEGSLRDAIVWAFFPKPVGIFFKCDKCNTLNPSSKKCLSCGEDINTKFNIEAEKKFSGKTLEITKIEDVDIDTITNYDIVKAPDEKTARKVYDHFINLVQHAYDVSNDFGTVAQALKENGKKGLSKIALNPETPIKVMLAQKVSNVDEGFEKVGRPAAIEHKYDGFRLQVHKKGDKILLFTRRLENVTKQFPEVVDLVKDHINGKNFILDSEAVGFNPKTGKYLPFQHISQRIRRKYDIPELVKKLPVELNVFDVVEYEGKNMLRVSFKERRDLIKSIVKNTPKKIRIAEQIVTEDNKKAQKFYEDSLKEGNEGVMFKSLDAPYKPGSRVGHMIKLKPVMESLDLVIVGAEWGTGKRGKWLSSFTLACLDEDTHDFVEVGKVGTGVKEKEEEGLTFNQMTELLKPHITSEKGREVKIKPKIVIEVHYEEIQKSPTYGSGYALRFPRVIRLREDRNPKEISTLDMVEELFFEQKK